jgi:hypothetical protein
MMADSTTEIDLDSVIDRLLEGELARYHPTSGLLHRILCMRAFGWKGVGDV